MTDQDWPITSVVVVADITKCPAGFSTIDRTFDRSDEADLWRDGLFARKVTRYLCVERSAPAPGKDVLVDVAIIQDRDPVPAGFAAIDYTHDTRERAIQKKILCVHWKSSNLTTTAISELIILPKGTKRPPNNYTMIGDLNNLMLCYKMSTIQTQSPMTNPGAPTLNMSGLANNLPYSMTPNQPTLQGYNQQPMQAGYQHTGNSNYSHPGPLQRGNSILNSNIATAISGIPWQLSQKLQSIQNLKDLQIPQIGYKTVGDIENQYSYDFNLERATTRSSSG